jgi:hypothetical protein
MASDNVPIRHSSADDSGFFGAVRERIRRILSSVSMSLAQLGLTQDKSYGPNRRPIIAYAAIGVIITAMLFYMAGSSITGDVVMKQIDECQNMVSDRDLTIQEAAEDMKACQDGAAALQSQLDNANSQITALQSQLAAAQQLTTDCQGNVDMLKSNVSAMQSYNAIMQGKLSTCQSSLDSTNATLRNSVAAVCCSYGDMQAGLVKNWQISNDRIVCSGASTVNCQTGALG